MNYNSWLSPLSMTVDKLPGIGKIYAKRLKEKNLSKLEDLVNLYMIKCLRNKTKFENELKYLTFMRQDTIEKLAGLIENIVRKN